ncbi:Protein MAIN-LIKE 1 [Glycine soja]
MSGGFCGTHLQIMVRTRGLGRALGHVTGRGVGRRDRDDSDDAPQRRRPTASAQRQRVAVTTAHDEPMIPAPDAAEDEHEGFLGGPSDPSVLTQYADHVACSVWTGEERLELKLSSHGRKVHSLGRPVLTIEGLVASTGLSPLIACSVDTGARGLLFSFVERWHREMSSFHLPVGELTIMLDDVSSLLHLPVVGDLHAFQPLHVDDAVQMLVDLLMVSAESSRAETAQCRGPYVRLQWSAINVHVVYLEALRDLSMTERYAWGVAALVHMYDQLNDASMSHSRQLDGYITLLQYWIYKHFPSVVDSTVDQDYDEDSLRACRWIVTKKTMNSIWSTWTDSGFRISVGSRMGSTDRSGTSTSYHVIPVSCAGGLLLFIADQRGWCGSLDTRRPFLLLLSIHGSRMMIYTTGGCTTRIISFQQVRCALCQCSSDYMDWFFRISHPFMTPGHALDPLPDVVPQASQTDIPHVPEPGASSTSVEVPKHAVEVCDDIAQRLERHLSLGVVTPGSSTHEVIKECLRLTKSVIHDHLVYVRSRRRRRTNQV